jgi:rhodanese-related sulfurtransferase
VDELDELKAAGAQIVDVRTPAEFAEGNVPGSLNIPLDQFPGRVAEIDRARPVLLCCAKGGRAGMAMQVLVKEGYTQVHNAGPWTRLL